jgi:integrase
MVMGRKRTPGLYKRGDVWNIDKMIYGQRLCESTGTAILEEAEKILGVRIEQIRHLYIHGERPKRRFFEAATKYLVENQHKASIADDAMHLKQLEPYIAELGLEQIHNGSLEKFVEARKKQGVKTKTINLALAVVRRILNLAASEWIDENNFAWLGSARKIRMLPITDARQPYPLSWEEQQRLFSVLPEHLREMALFKVNTGCREQEVCQLQWEWEVEISELNTSVFLIPASIVKNRYERLVVLNNITKNVIERLRGQHSTHVFSYKGSPVKGINNSAWKRARKSVNLSQVRVHDLKHTFGRRLRASGVSYEDRQDLLGHKSSRITTHYSAAELTNLIDAANKVCAENNQNISVTLIRQRSGLLNALSRKSPARDCVSEAVIT